MNTADLGACRFHLYGVRYCDRPATERVVVVTGANAMSFCAEHAETYRAADRDHAARLARPPEGVTR